MGLREQKRTNELLENLNSRQRLWQANPNLARQMAQTEIAGFFLIPLLVFLLFTRLGRVLVGAIFAILLYFAFLWFQFLYESSRSVNAADILAGPEYRTDRGYGFTTHSGRDLKPFKCSRRLTDDAIELIASTDISFLIEPPISREQLERLVRKRDGWLIFQKSLTVDNIQKFKNYFQDSAVNVWLVYPLRDIVAGLSTYKGKVRLDLNGREREEAGKAAQVLQEAGKEVEVKEYY